MTLSTRLYRTLSALLFALFSPLTLAGSPGPFSLVFMDISPAPLRDGYRLALELRNLDSLPAPRSSDCFFCASNNDGINSVGMLYIYTVPAGLSPEVLRRAVEGDKAAIRDTQAVLNNFEYRDGSGVDGLVIYDHQPGKVTLYTMGKSSGETLESVSKPVKNRLALSSLDVLLEKAANKLERGI